MTGWRFPAAAGIVLTLALASPACALKLERVVLVQRHGVRPPTSTNAALAKYSAAPWPSWPAAPGELTAHGAQTVALMGASLRATYQNLGLLPKGGCPTAAQVVVWADGTDQRTRRSGEVLAQALAPGCGVKAGWGAARPRDPIFDATLEPACRFDPRLAHAAFQTAIGPGGLDTAATTSALSRLQAIVAPGACRGGPGMCFGGKDEIIATPAGPRGKGPMFIGASLAEDLLLEYTQGMPLAEVGWGRAGTPAAIAAIMPLHERPTVLMRRDHYFSTRAGAAMARLVLSALAAESGPHSGPAVRLLALAGHDTNIDLMGGAFGLDWSLPGEPDSTSPAQTLAFELWRDHAHRFVRAVMYYETLDQLRTLAPAGARRVALRFAGCASGPMHSCPLTRLRRRLEAEIPPGCGEPAAEAPVARR